MNTITQIINKGKALITFKELQENFDINIKSDNEFSTCFLEVNESGKEHYILTIGYDNGENWCEVKKEKEKDLFFYKLQSQKPKTFNGVKWS